MAQTTNHYRNRQERNLDSCEVEAQLNTEGTIFHDNGDTECRVTLLTSSGKTYYGEGFAYLAPGDHFVRSLGEQLAYARATIEAMEDMELDIISASKTEGQYQAESYVIPEPKFSAADRLAKLFPERSVACGPNCVACKIAAVVV